MNLTEKDLRKRIEYLEFKDSQHVRRRQKMAAFEVHLSLIIENQREEIKRLKRKLGKK